MEDITVGSEEPVAGSPESVDTPPVEDKGSVTPDGQGSSTVTSGDGQAGTQELDPELKNWMDSKGMSVETLTAEPTKYLSMMRESESYHSKQINDIKAEYENKIKAYDAKLAVGDTGSEEPKRPSEATTEKYEGMVANLFDTLGVQSIDELRERYPEESYPQIYQNLNGINQKYQAEYQKALAADVEFLVGGQKKSSEKEIAESKFQQEWEGIKKTVEGKFTDLKKENPKVESQIVASGVGEVVKTLSDYTKIPEAYYWNDGKLFDFFVQASSAIEFMKNAPKLQEEMEQKAMAKMQKQKQVDTPSATTGFNTQYGRGVSLTE